MCEYCEGAIKDRKTIIENGNFGKAYVGYSELKVFAYKEQGKSNADDTYIIFNISNCPMCGRNIESMNCYDEPRFLLDMDSICYGCAYYASDADKECTTPEICVEGSMNGYRMDG